MISDNLTTKTYNTSLNTINENFYQLIVEKENEIQLTGPNEENIQELAILYKKAIEHFSGISNERVLFYNHKLTRLIMAVQKNKKKKNSKPSHWSNYVHKHKKYANKIMLFFKLESNKTVVNDMIDKINKDLNNGINIVNKNIFEQSKKFYEKREIKINKLKDKLLNGGNNENKIIKQILPYKRDKIDVLLKDLLKKIHYTYMHSKIFEIPIETLSNIFEDMYYHKIKKYFYYQEQIKQFDLLLNDEDNNEHDESIQFLLKDLTNERKSYFQKIEELILNIKSNINEKCSNTNIENEYYINKYKIEFMNNIGKIFK